MASRVSVWVCVFVCVCARERERDRENCACRGGKGNIRQIGSKGFQRGGREKERGEEGGRDGRVDGPYTISS